MPESGVFLAGQIPDQFNTLVSTYSNVVQLAFAGHIHMDDFRVTVADPSLLPLRITPSVSPIFKNNPGFSVMTYDLTTASVSDITTYFLSLSSPTPHGQRNISFPVHTTLTHSARPICPPSPRPYAMAAPHERPLRMTSLSPRRHRLIRRTCSFYSCAQTAFTSTSYSDCVCGVAALKSHSDTPHPM